jgi:dihydroorotase
MNVLIKQALIIDPKSQYHLQRKDLLIQKGKIERIDDLIQADVQEIAGENLHISRGWIDLSANLGDPGFEQKEDLTHGLKAAAAGGFTTVVVSSETSPVRDTKAQVEYLVNNTKQNLVNALPYGSISINNEGKELAELFDLREAGAIAFSDGKKSIQNPNLLLRALQYVKAFDGVVMNFPKVRELSQGVMNEGVISTHLGLKGIPELAENLMVMRDIKIAEYVEGKIHFNTISSGKSLELIKEAKKNKLPVSCDVAAYQLLLSDEYVQGFDTRFKTQPPLRSKETIQQLIKGIKDGTINAICSDHQPQDIESKKKEFDHAAFGVINLQTAFAAANTALKRKLDISKLIDLFTKGPAELLGIHTPEIKEKEVANITIFQPDTKFTLTKDLILSKSKNSPFINQELYGNVVGVINRNQLHLNT